MSGYKDWHDPDELHKRRGFGVFYTILGIVLSLTLLAGLVGLSLA